MVANTEGAPLQMFWFDLSGVGSSCGGKYDAISQSPSPQTGLYNPAGALSTTWVTQRYIDTVPFTDMSLRPNPSTVGLLV